MVIGALLSVVSGDRSEKPASDSNVADSRQAAGAHRDRENPSVAAFCRCIECVTWVTVEPRRAVSTEASVVTSRLAVGDPHERGEHLGSRRSVSRGARVGGDVCRVAFCRRCPESVFAVPWRVAVRAARSHRHFGSPRLMAVGRLQTQPETMLAPWVPLLGAGARAALRQSPSRA